MGCPGSQCGAWDAPRAVLGGGMCGMLGGAGDALGLSAVWSRVWGTLGCAGGSGSVLCGGLWGGAVGCGTGVIYAALRCVEVLLEVLRKRTVLGGLERWL